MKKLKPKIAVYAISKNEQPFIRRFYESSKDADLILIADTGSTDNTVAAAKECGMTVYEICISPWRFDHARNAALALIPKDIDICVSLDLDEELQPGWREEIERLWIEGTTRLRYEFDWGMDIKFMAEKIHSRHGYHWHHPCHEYIIPDGRISEIWANSNKLLVVHKPDPTKSRGQYLDLLALSVKEDPNCPRNAFYYARELTFYSKWEEAIVALTSYLKLPTAVWTVERSYAMRLLANSHFELGHHQEALKWARLAVAESPESRETWCELAMMCYKRSMWTECYSAASSALLISHRALLYTSDPKVWTEHPHDLASISAWNLGLKEEAIKHITNAVALAPDNVRLQNNLKFMTE